MGWRIFVASERDRETVAGWDGVSKGVRTSIGVATAAGFYGYQAGERLLQMIEHLEAMELEIEKREREHARELAEQEKRLGDGRGSVRRNRSVTVGRSRSSG